MSEQTENIQTQTQPQPQLQTQPQQEQEMTEANSAEGSTEVKVFIIEFAT